MPATPEATAPAGAAGALCGMRAAAVAAKLGLSVRAVWRLVHTDPTFPRPRKIGGATVWLSDAVERYLEQLPEAR